MIVDNVLYTITCFVGIFSFGILCAGLAIQVNRSFRG